MNRSKKVIIALVAALILLPAVLSAQGMDAARERLRGEYDRSQQVIERAQNVINEASQYRQNW